MAVCPKNSGRYYEFTPALFGEEQEADDSF
jgi:hypothetical protein